MRRPVSLLRTRELAADRLSAGSFITLADVTFHHSPFWTTHFYNSTDIHVRGLRVDNPAGGPHGTAPFVSKHGYGPNADGIDVEHSRRVLIEDSRIHCGDVRPGVCLVLFWFAAEGRLRSSGLLLCQDAICLKAGEGP